MNRDNSSSTPKFKQDQIEYLRRVFSPKPVVPGMSMDEIMFNAGIQTVVDFCASNVGLQPLVHIRD